MLGRSWHLCVFVRSGELAASLARLVRSVGWTGERVNVNAKAPSLLCNAKTGINKRLSFAEEENGQKDRNKEVQEEREAATEKGINKAGWPEKRWRAHGTQEQQGQTKRNIPILSSILVVLALPRSPFDLLLCGTDRPSP